MNGKAKSFIGLMFCFGLLISCSLSESNTVEPVIAPSEVTTKSEERSVAPIEEPNIQYLVNATGDIMNGEQLCEGFYFGFVIDKNGNYIVDGNRPVVLLDNINATNPSYQELLAFLKADGTELYSYHSTVFLPSITGESIEDTIDKEYLLSLIKEKAHPNIPQACAGFAEILHNNAEIAGIRAGYVLTADHAFNVFETIDEGLVYIDCTGSLGWEGGSIDCRVYIDEVGKLRLEPLHQEDKGKEVYYTSSILFAPSYWSSDYKPPEPIDIYFEEIIWVGSLLY